MTTKGPFILLALRIPLLQLTPTSYPHSRKNILQLTKIPVSLLFLSCLRHLPTSLRRKLLWASNLFPLVQQVGQMVCVPSTSRISPVSQLRGGRELLSSLTSFINHILEGNAPHSVCPILFGATLIALRKKEGGIRPIAIGLTLHRLAAKIGGFRVVHQSVGSALAPLQLGCGVPSGCEAAARAAHQYLKSMPSNHVLLKVDFRNAFNSVRRDKILEAVKSSIPDQ